MTQTHKSRYAIIYRSTEPGKTLACSTLFGSRLAVPAALADRIEEGRVEEPERSTLLRMGILVEDPAAELEMVRGLLDSMDARNTVASVLATLNVDCNLACPYCYEDTFRGKRHMSEETAALLVRRLLSEPAFAGKKLVVDFYGGEPLLSLPLIRRISAALRGAPGGFSFNLVTNGTLFTEKVAEELLPLGLSGVRFTLDGPKRVHDEQRPFAGGKGSFDTILRNLKATCRMVPIHLGGNFTRQNYKLFPELLDLLASEGIGGNDLKWVNFAPVMPPSSQAGMKDFSIGCASGHEPWLVEASLYLREETLRRGFQVPKVKLGACMVEFDSNLVVAVDGALYKCPTFMGWPELSIGTLETGLGDHRELHGVGAWKNDECLGCAYLPHCFGGCRFLRRLQTGSIAGIDCRRELLNASLERMLRQELGL